MGSIEPGVGGLFGSGDGGGLFGGSGGDYFMFDPKKKEEEEQKQKKPSSTPRLKIKSKSSFHEHALTDDIRKGDVFCDQCRKPFYHGYHLRDTNIDFCKTCGFDRLIKLPRRVFQNLNQNNSVWIEIEPRL